MRGAAKGGGAGAGAGAATSGGATKSAGAAVLTARGLAVGRDGRTLLRGVDLELRRGEVVAVLGPNGVGKSTLVAVLAGLLPATEGVVEVDGRVAASLQAPAFARRSVEANLVAALGWWGVPRAERAARAGAALATMQAQALGPRLATELSGGEARRVHLARALALQADALLLDEPFAGLDPVARADLLGDAGRALRDAARATLVVVHDRAEAWAIADRLIVVLDGGVAADGEPRALLDGPPTEPVAAFLGFTGVVDGPGSRLRVRPAQVSIVAARGDTDGVVERVVPEEDSVLCEVVVDGGRVQVRAAHPGPAVGERVRLRIDGGVRFPR